MPRKAGVLAAEAVKTPAEAAKLDFFARTTFAAAAAWSPNPQNPPLYLDLPTKNGVVQPSVLARWAANAPLAMIDQYVVNLRQFHAIAIDVGDQDGLRTDTAELHRILDVYGVTHSFEVYNGTHTSAVAGARSHAPFSAGPCRSSKRRRGTSRQRAASGFPQVRSSKISPEPGVAPRAVDCLPSSAGRKARRSLWDTYFARRIV
jgi:hypothetical protein